MKRFFLLFSLLIFSFVTFSQSQKDLKIPVDQTIVLNFIDHVTYIQILATDNNVNPNDDLYYYWYKANDIKVTRGGFDGKLLHGIYTDFYINKNLKEKGKFRYGLKTGEWKCWHMNGEYQEVSYWRRGKRHGKTKFYNEKGRLVKEYSYKKNELHGKCIEFDEQGKKHIMEYKNGEVYEKEPLYKKLLVKKNKDKKAKKDTEIKEPVSEKKSRKKNKKKDSNTE